jgi:hypothetical protein
MPVTRSRNGLYDMNLDQTNTTRFLFGDDEPHSLPRGRTPDDNFPTLVRRDDQMVSEKKTLACKVCCMFLKGFPLRLRERGEDARQLGE